ncbi:restriction endonuclease subunit S [Bisgaard Taxon 46]
MKCWKNLPRGVKLFKINELCSVRGEIIAPQIQQGEVNYIGLENIESETGKITGSIKTEYQLIKSAKNVFYKDDILYGKLRPNLNKVYYSEMGGVCSTDILVLVTNNSIMNKLFYYHLISKVFNDKVLKTVSGQQLPRTSWEKMGSIKVPVPPLAKQQEIVAEIEGYEAEILQLEKTMQQNAAKKKAILQRFL